jgi:REP element-mobilizing transposase RayT
MNSNKNSDPKTKQRKSIRLKGFDYSQAGSYFITISTLKKMCLFGEVVDEVMQVNPLGKIVQECWTEIPIHFPIVTTDAFVIMPNHIHGVIFINEKDIVTVGARHVLHFYFPLLT